MEITTVCQKCGKEFTYTYLGGAKRKYCSDICARRTGSLAAYYRRKKGNEYGYSQNTDLYRNIVVAYRGRCAICGWQATEKNFAPNGKMVKSHGNEIHHIVGVKDGGKAVWDNLILLCPNHHKQANLGIIPIEEVRGYLKPETAVEEAIEEARGNSAARIEAAIFGEE